MCGCCEEARFTVDALCWCDTCHEKSVPFAVKPATIEEWYNSRRALRQYGYDMYDLAQKMRDDAVEYVRGEVHARRDKGTICPACDQYAKVYRRKINSGMARSLIQMYRAGGTTWVDVTTVTDRRSREEGKLAYWGLVEEYPVGREDGGRAGMWRVTGKGKMFIFGEVNVPQFAEVYNGRCLRTYGREVSIATALGTAFSYHDLMEGV